MSGSLQTLAYSALAAQLVCFAAIAWASRSRFRADRDSTGMMVLRILSVGATFGLGALVLVRDPAPGPASLLTLFGAALSLALLWSALSAVAPRTLDVAFTGDGPDRLVTDGVYGRIRNPLYTSYLIYWAAWIGVAAGHPAAIAGFALFLAIYWLAVRQEEAFLKQRFGDLYLAYRARTGRFLPRLSPWRRA